MSKVISSRIDDQTLNELKEAAVQREKQLGSLVSYILKAWLKSKHQKEKLAENDIY